MPRPIGVVGRVAPIDGETPRKVLLEPLYFPALLGELAFEEEFTHVDFETHRAGEFSVPAQGGETARRLRPFNPEFLTIDWEASWLTEYTDPEVVRDTLIKIGRSRRAVQLLLVLYRGRGQANVRAESEKVDVTIRRIVRTIKPGESDTRYWQLEMKEWRPLTGARLTRRADWPKRHKLKAVTSLHGLSKRYYGTTKYWRTIAKANKVDWRRWGADTPLVRMKRFKEGDVVTIPAPPVATRGAAALGREGGEFAA